MGDKMYIRLCENLADKGKLILDTEDVYKHINTLNKDYYVSVYKYNEKHKEQFDKTGSVAGITDVTTNRIIFDFDDENLDNAKKDTLTAFKRLTSKGIKAENINIYYSGKKGFHLTLETDQSFTPNEMKAIAKNIAGDLETFDTKVYNSNRILRLPYTRHPDTKLYKTPISYEELNLPLVQIKDIAKDEYEVELPVTVKLPTSIINLKVEAKEVKEVAKIETTKLDLSKRPKNLSPWKYALSQGYFPSGQRNHAFDIMARTYHNLGYDKTQTYYLLKAMRDKQATLFGQDKFDKTELFNSILKYVFSDHNLGGTYSEDHFDDGLKDYLVGMGIPRKHEADSFEKYHPKKIGDIGAKFEDFVMNYEKHLIKTGIKSIDDALPMTPGLNLGIIGAAGSGKCLGKDTPVIMYDGTLKMVQDVKVGDLLMGDDSTPRMVLSLARGRENLYTVKQRNGDDYVVNESHILSLQGSTTRKGAYLKGKIYDICVTDYLNSSKQFKKYIKGYKVPVSFSKKSLELDPYILGAWLGDGTTSKPEFTINRQDIELLSYIGYWGNSENLEVNLKEYKSSSDQVYTVTITSKNKDNKFRKFLNNSGLSKRKVIPHNFLTSDKKDRLNLLAGLLDTDGYLDTKKNTFELSSSDKELSDQILYLCRSLGFKTSITKENKKYKSFTKGKLYEGYAISYRLYITGDNLGDIPTKLVRKQAVNQNKQRFQDLTEIELVSMGEGDYYGFEIDGNRRFLLGDFTVTHNTSIALKILEYSSENNIPCILASIDMHGNRLYEKLLYRISGLSREELYAKFKNGEADELKELVREKFKNVYVYDRSAASISDLRQYHKHIEETEGVKIKLTMVDYFERIQSDVSDDTARSLRVANEWQDYINDFGHVGIMFVQPNKFSLSGGPDTPILNYTAIKGSSFLYQSFRAIVSLWRPFYHPDWKNYDNYMKIAILKNDLGELDTFSFAWDGKRGDITELDDNQRERLNSLIKDKEGKNSNDDDF